MTLAQIEFLGTVSARLQDQRILAAATQAARNTAYSRVIRLAAIRTLVGQFDPGIAVKYTYDKPQLGLHEGRFYVALGVIADVDRIHPGAHPPTSADSAGIIATFRQLGQADPDDVVRKIAAYLAERFAVNDLPTADRGQQRRR